MKYDFTYYNPTRIHFGKNAMEKLPEELSGFGENVLLLYGKNAIKATGLYDEVVKILASCATCPNRREAASNPSSPPSSKISNPTRTPSNWWPSIKRTASWKSLWRNSAARVTSIIPCASFPP